MSYLLWHTIADVSGNWLGIHDEQKTYLHRAQDSFDYQQRNITNVRDQGVFFSLWPQSRGQSGDPTAPMYPIGNEVQPFEQVQQSDSGASRYYFVMGSVTDVNGNKLASVALDLYLASTGAFVAAGITDQNGNYQLPTPFAGANHFIYANYANGTYVGASIATLTPNF